MLIRVVYSFYLQVLNYFNGFSNFRFKDIFCDWSVFEIAWLLISVGSLAVISVLTANDYLFLTTVATVTGMLNMLLVAKGKIFNYFFAFVNNLTYAYICYNQGIYGQFLLFIFFFFPMQFYGLYIWTKPRNISKNNYVITRVLAVKQRVYLISGITIAAILYGAVILNGYFNQQVGLVADSLTDIMSIVAIVLMVKAYIEQWALWVVINILSTIIWIEQCLSGTGDGIAFLAMWLIYLFNAIYGYINWLKLKNDP